MGIKIFYRNDKEFEEALELRFKVLREPIGITRQEMMEEIQKEKDDIYFGFYKDKLIGLVIVTVLNEEEVKFRQMGVYEEYRGQGIGKQLMVFMEEFLKQKNFKIIYANARVQALQFYDRLGYQVISDEFVEVGIPHRKIKKIIN